MKTRVTESKKGRSILLTFYEGFSTYTITVPMPYALRFLSEALVTGVNMLKASEEMQKLVDSKEGEKAEVLELIRRAARDYGQIAQDTEG